MSQLYSHVLITCFRRHFYWQKCADSVLLILSGNLLLAKMRFSYTCVGYG